MTRSQPLRLDVVHRTEYRYSAEMTDGYTIAHLLPRPTPLQRVEHADVVSDPTADERDAEADVFGNSVVRLGLHQPHEHLTVTAHSVVELHPPPGVDELRRASGSWRDAVAAVHAARGDAALEASPFAARTARTATSPAVEEFARDVFGGSDSLVDALAALCTRIHREFEFDPTFSDVSTPVDAVIAARRGVCQDFAHLALSCLRAVGLASRYVSGYLETERIPGEEELTGADVSHAWCSVWSPDVGWLDLDPTNDQFPPTRHVTVAWGRDYGDVAPVRGVVIGPRAAQTLAVTVEVRRL